MKEQRLKRFIPFLVMLLLGVLVILCDTAGYFFTGLFLFFVLVFYSIWKILED